VIGAVIGGATNAVAAGNRPRSAVKLPSDPLGLSHGRLQAVFFAQIGILGKLSVN